jgi:NosR/NirI family transcriptional regulator, nitrous oxide reductase regulator
VQKRLNLAGATAAGAKLFPPPDFESGYTFPAETFEPPAGDWWVWLDGGLLLIALTVAAWLVHRRRSRRGLVLLAIASLAWFGFVREGCVCSVGALQNVTASLFTSMTLPVGVLVFFMLPLLFALFFGRVFCAAVCPLGAAQELVLVRSTRVPRWLDSFLGSLPYIHLALAVLFAATGLGFIICRYDPFVRIFRLSGGVEMVVVAGAFVLLSLFVGRPYCRWLCPYGALLALLGLLARREVRIPPGECVNCHLCRHSCPYGAIRPTTESEGTARAAARHRFERGLLVVTMVALPLLGFGGYLGGRTVGPALAQLHPSVEMEKHVAVALAGGEEVSPGLAVDSDLLDGFGRRHEAYLVLATEASSATERVVLGTGIFGAFLGLFLALRVAALVRRWPQQEYVASRMDCVGCARCYPDCPVPADGLEEPP